MLTALAQSLLPSSTNQQVQIKQIIFFKLILKKFSFQQLLADLQAAATLVNKQKLLSPNDNNQHELNSRIQTNRTDSQDNLPHITQAKRRATHNAVERRRRDRINQHIQQLSKLIPDCSNYVKNQVNLLFEINFSR
jgi:hypothetical protein